MQIALLIEYTKKGSEYTEPLLSINRKGLVVYLHSMNGYPNPSESGANVIIKEQFGFKRWYSNSSEESPLVLLHCYTSLLFSITKHSKVLAFKLRACKTERVIIHHFIYNYLLI
ncbi:MAG: hypothetical protein ACJA1A_003626 [Saprospiraceae bacterium]|jgi:hypothetical protein|tara:strand:+ start:307 stop:648 length:342 start_codon:yes stop_codon:yes gene_type:complete